MERFRQVLLDIWREACRQIELHESAATMLGMLQQRMPLEAIVVQRVDVDRLQIATLAVAPPSAPFAARGVRTCSATGLKKLRGWIRKGDVLTAAAGAQYLANLGIETGDREVAIAPLSSASGTFGAMVAIARRDEAFNDQHRLMLDALREPLSVALENDSRFHEVVALRQAAEADRQALLRRLGRQELDEAIIGEDSGLRLVMERVNLVTSSDLPVLILGETGTGKEVIARAIHNRSKRHEGPFIRVNCGAIPAELIDSQLFGHEKGSFTGAAESRQGWFERADGGTLFLDEIGELPLNAQVRFLRVLQDGFVERVGGHDSIRVDVRVVAATHRDLPAMVRDNKFREDLWYRIAVFPILLPPLRDRVEDIPDLVAHFSQKAANRFGLPRVTPTADDIRLLQSYPWPGNIRELGAVLDRAAILGNGQRLDISTALGLGGGPAAPTKTPATVAVSDAAPIATLDDAIRRHIEAALAQSRGRIEGPRGAAAMLDINPHTLRAKMRKLGIAWGEFRK
jgi:transcriptional regulator with GAF, ATPase, and Fis domain